MGTYSMTDTILLLFVLANTVGGILLYIVSLNADAGTEISRKARTANKWQQTV